MLHAQSAMFSNSMVQIARWFEPALDYHPEASRKHSMIDPTFAIGSVLHRYSMILAHNGDLKAVLCSMRQEKASIGISFPSEIWRALQQVCLCVRLVG